MSTYVDKPLSLVEKKKLQWAKEREELSGLCAPWGTKDNRNCERLSERNRYVSKFPMANNNNEFFRKDYTSPVSRRSSLPPLYKNQYNSIEMAGETSGYGSDNPNQQTPYLHSGYESSSSYKDDRPKWKDKNKFWDSTENDPPNWVKRGLQRDEEIIVSNTSPAESPQQDIDPDRPNTGSSSFNRTYIRGQNVPVDSTELAERERRRQVALAHQEAIRQQLEERERRRREEKEKRIQEELEEELRIEREQEIERQRKEEELRLIKEKQERERKRKEALQEALEIAEKEAKLEKMKLKMMKQNRVESPSKDEKEIINNNVVIHNNIEKESVDNEKRNNLEQQNNNNAPKQEMLKNEINNNLEIKGKSLISPRNNESKASTTPRENLNNYNNTDRTSFHVLTTPRSEMALVLQTPLEALQNMQYAVLMPGLNSSTSTAIPIAIPLTIASDRTPINTSRTENRILTPTQYRNRNKRLCDSSTQTEYIDQNEQRYVREKLTNLELNNRKERRTRSDERSNVEERPKWGANRPPTRYLKQSEKDPLYQRRKLRQKMREVKVYDDKNSSDDSQTCSPRSYRKKNYVEKRHTRALWRKNDHYFARNIQMYQTEIVPLESDKEQIYYKLKCDCCCRCNCRTHSEERVIEHNSPRDRLPDCSDNNENVGYIIDKLANLHNGLILKQEHWERSPRTPTLSSSTRNTENN